MSKDSQPPEKLRKKAEAKLLKEKTGGRAPKFPKETRNLLQEFQVYRIELELQNEELRSYQEKLEASHARLQDLYDFAPIGYLTLDETGLIQEINLTAAALLDIPRNALLNRPLSDFVLPEDQDLFHHFCHPPAASPAPRTCELHMLRNGRPFWARLDAGTCRDTEGLPGQQRLVLSDIDEYKKAEESRDSMQAQLLNARRLESVGRLAGGVAHDFNNMLQVILGRTEKAISATTQDSPVHSDLREIRKAAERSAYLTRQLLAFAKKQPLALEILNINDSIENILTMLRRLIGTGIELTWLPGSNLGSIKMDPSQIDQILVNLCINARDAIDGHGEIVISTDSLSIDDTSPSTRTTLPPGDYVRLCVRDDGHGMSLSTQSHLFEPFFSTKAPDKGTGMGLATVYGIVTQHKGFIDVESAPAQGTAIIIHLPLCRETPRKKNNCNQIEDIIQPGMRTVLLVEDETSILEITTEILEEAGYTVLPASGPKQALYMTSLHTGPIDMLVTDMMMPDMNGKKLAEHLRSFLPDLPCLYMTGYAADALPIETSASKQDMLEKPFTRQELLTRIQRLLCDSDKMRAK